MSELEGLISEYAEQINILDTGLSSQAYIFYTILIINYFLLHVFMF